MCGYYYALVLVLLTRTLGSGVPHTQADRANSPNPCPSTCSPAPLLSRFNPLPFHSPACVITILHDLFECSRSSPVSAATTALYPTVHAPHAPPQTDPPPSSTEFLAEGVYGPLHAEHKHATKMTASYYTSNTPMMVDLFQKNSILVGRLVFCYPPNRAGSPKRIYADPPIHYKQLAPRFAVHLASLLVYSTFLRLTRLKVPTLGSKMNFQMTSGHERWYGRLS